LRQFETVPTLPWHGIVRAGIRKLKRSLGGNRSLAPFWEP